MLCEPNVRIIFFGGWRCEEEDSGLWSAVKLSLADQFFSDALFLVENADRQIGKIREVRKIRYGTRNANQQFCIPCGDDKVCILKHRGESRPIVDRTTRA